MSRRKKVFITRMVSKTVVSIFILGAALKVLKKYKSKKNKRIIKDKDTRSLDK